MRNAAKMRVRGYRNSGNKTPSGLTIWVKTINGVKKRKTANGTPVNNGRTTNNGINMPMSQSGGGSMYSAKGAYGTNGLY